MGKEYVMRSVRVKFEKTGNAKYISHLDLNRFMLKIIRMSKIPVWYSEGFNPHPYITFALPLSLGFESTYEFMDIRLHDDSFTNENVYSSIKELMPKGINILSCFDPLMKAGQIAFADYKVSFTQYDSDVISSLCDYLSSDSILANKKTKKGAFKEVNLKEFIKGYRICDSALILTLSAGGANNLNPKLILESFEKFSNIKLPFYNIVRTMLYNEKMEEFK